jgi:hypothetical protein
VVGEVAVNNGRHRHLIHHVRELKLKSAPIRSVKLTPSSGSKDRAAHTLHNPIETKNALAELRQCCGYRGRNMGLKRSRIGKQARPR